MMFRKQSGDTLVEVTVAMGVLAMVIASSVVLGTASVRVGRDAKLRSQAVELAQAQAESLRGYRDSVSWNTFFNEGNIKGGGDFHMVRSGGVVVPAGGPDTFPQLNGLATTFTVKVRASEPFTSEVDYNVQVTWPSSSGGPQNIVEFNSILTNPLAKTSDALAAQAIGSTIQGESFTAPGGCYGSQADPSASNGQTLAFCSSNSWPVSFSGNLPKFSSITISAKQSLDPGATDGQAGPTMQLEMDGCMVYSGVVSSTSYTVTVPAAVPSPCNSNAGWHTIHIQMQNDSCSQCPYIFASPPQAPPPGTGDRNLFVDYITLNP